MTTADLTGVDAAPEPRRAALTRNGVIVVSVLSAVALVLVVVCVALALQQRSRSQQRDRLEQARSAAVRAARQEILNLDALSAPTVDRDLARVLDGATGTFAGEFAKSQPNLKTIITSQKTMSEGTVLASGVVRADEVSATVLVAVDRRVRDVSNTTGVVAHDRWQLDLEEHGGRWLVAVLQPVS